MTRSYLKEFIWIVQDFRYHMSGYYDRPTRKECFEFIQFLLGTSIEEFISVYPIEKTYDGDKYGQKDYFYSKRALDTLLSSGKTHFESLEDIFDFFFEVQMSNKAVTSIVINALCYVMDSAGYDAIDVIDRIEYLRYYGRKTKETHYLKLVK